MKNGSYLPDMIDFFPRTRRGHGSTHSEARFDKWNRMRQIRNACVCVNPACELHRRQREDGERRGEAHRDQYANAADWKVEHGFHADTPIEECFS